MLVLKRALSITLSFALAYSPTLAFAKPKQKVHRPHFQAESTEQYNRDRDLAEQRKLAASKKFGTKPQTRQAAKIEHALDLVAGGFHTIKSRGKSYQVYSSPGNKTRGGIKITRGEDFQEVLVDEYGTGTASRWEVTRGETKFTAMDPYRGAFVHLEVEQRRAGGYVKARLTLNTDWKTYRLTKISLVPNTVEGDNETSKTAANANRVMIGSEIEATTDENKCLIDSTKQVRSFIERIVQTSTQDDPTKALACEMNQYKNFYVDSSCSDPTTKFNKNGVDTSKDIAEALAKVFMSADKPGVPPRYLACLKEHKFAWHAAQIQKNINDYTQKYVVPTASKYTRNSTCQEIPDDTQIEAAFSTDHPKMFTCKLPDNLQAEAGKDVADYRNDGTMQVVFNKPANATLNKLKSITPGLDNAVDAYAMLIMHEMLHQSGIRSEDNEQLVQDLEHCCAEPKSPTDSSNPACNRVDQYTYNQRFRQDNENKLSMYWPGYDQMRANAEASLGMNGTNGATDRFMAETFSDLMRDRETGTAFDALQSCESESQADKVACQTAFDKSVNERFKQVAMKNCEAEKKEISGVSCTNLVTSMTKSMDDGSKLTVQIPMGMKNTVVTVTVPQPSPRTLDGYGDLSNPIYNEKLQLVPLNIPDSAIPTLSSSTAGSSKTAKGKVAASGSTRARVAGSGSGTSAATGSTATGSAATGTASTGTRNSGAAPQETTGEPIVVTAKSRGSGSTAVAGNGTSNSGSANGGSANSGSANGGSSTNVSAGSGLSDDGPAPTDANSQQASNQQQQQAVDPTTQAGFASNSYVPSVSSTTTKPSSTATNSFSSKPMDFTSGAVAASGVDRGPTFQAAQTAKSLVDGASSLANSAVSTFEKAATSAGLPIAAAQAAPIQRSPAAYVASASSSSSGFRSGGGSRSLSSDDQPAARLAPEKAQAAERASDDQPMSRPADPKAQSAALDTIDAVQFNDSTDLVIKLKGIANRPGVGVQFIEAQLRDPSSQLSQKARALNLRVERDKSGALVLRSIDKKLNRCYKTDPKLILKPCG